MGGEPGSSPEELDRSRSSARRLDEIGLEAIRGSNCLHDVTRRLSAGRMAAMLGLILMCSGCYCFRYSFLSFEGQPEIRVTERRLRFHAGWTFPPVPTRYEIERPDYILELSTGARSSPGVDIRARRRTGGYLQILGSGVPWPVELYGPTVTPGVHEGAISLVILQDQEWLGSETLDFTIRSRAIACELDLP